MNRLVFGLIVLSACAPKSLREVHAMGLFRQGSGSVTDLHVVIADVHLHTDPPRTLLNAEALALPAHPPLEEWVLERDLVATLGDIGLDYGLSVTGSTELGHWDHEVPDAMPQLLAVALAEGSEGALALRIHLGWCPVEGDWAVCVRSPDTALGEGPPALEGWVYSGLQARLDGVIAMRVSVVQKRFVYTIDKATHAHLDRPFVGRGGTGQEQAEDALEQALRAWVVAYVGRSAPRP